MNKNHPGIDRILGMLRSKEITPEEGARLIRELQNKHMQLKMPAVTANAAKRHIDMTAAPVKDIAIIGMSGRFPGAENIYAYWDNLAAGVDSITEVPKDRWDIDLYYDPDAKVPNKTYCRWMGAVPDIDKFDSLFFNISPREADFMDPQHRLFMEESWRALEDAGYPPETLSGKKCGIFVGATKGDYDWVFNESKTNYDSLVLMGMYHAFVSARVAYFLDLNGPNMAVDTACSSSLVAIHLGCHSIHDGESELVLAGGVGLLTSPFLHITAAKAELLSRQGQCKTFDNDADGMMPGEGVGVLVLKSLDKALLDKDHIYGVIKGTAINQDGKTNGITSPSANSQTQLEIGLYDKYKINPEHIDYIEAHGTGTKLGDPIEVSALTRAFRHYTEKKHFCVIGSVKANIGHSLTAAGVASLIKVLLCFKYKKMTPSIHFDKANEHINFQDSPFYVNTQLIDWPSRDNRPRLAAISSFGLSGTNCHIVVTEAPGSDTRIANTREISQDFPPQNLPVPYYIIPFSAKKRESLLQKIKDLAAWLEKDGAHENLGDIVYTLQVGRSHFPVSESVRAALVVDATDREDLKRKLREINPEPNSIPLKPMFKEMGKRIIKELQDPAALQAEEYREKLLALADLYAGGYDFDWRDLYPAGTDCFRRISLPTYPFEKRRCWLKTNTAAAGEDSYRSRGGFPLFVDRINFSQSLPGGIIFEKTVRPGDLLVKDHVVLGRPIIPGVGYLEMAFAAASMVKGDECIGLADVVWQQPLAVQEDSKEVRIVIKEEDRDLKYEIQNIADGHLNVHARGKVLTGKRPVPPPEEYLDIPAIKARCPRNLDKKTLYTIINEKGCGYGPYFQGVVHLWGSTEEALAQLCLPPGYEKELASCTLHPSLMDSAIQTVGGYILSLGERKLMLPFAIEKLEIFYPLQAKCYAYVKVIDRERFHVYILDDKGKVCIKLHDVVLRELKVKEQSQVQAENLDHFFFRPTWKQTDREQEINRAGQTALIIYPPLDPGLEKALAAAHHAHNHDVISIRLGTQNQELSAKQREIDICDPLALENALEKIEKIDCIYFLAGIDAEKNAENGTSAAIDLDILAEKQERGVLSLFRLVKALSARGFTHGPLALKVITGNTYTIIPGEALTPYYAGLPGFTLAMAKEYGQWNVCCIDIDINDLNEDSKRQTLVKEILMEPGHSFGRMVGYRDGRRYEQTLEKVILRSEPAAPAAGNGPGPFKQQGVYLILGGMGGIGLELSLYLAETVQARLVLIDRMPLAKLGELGDRQKNRLTEIEAKGGKVLYLQADAIDPASMQAAVNAAKSQFGGINGVFHSAIVLKDRTLERMDEETLTTVLAPKVRATAVLYNTLKAEPLDFMMFFSSAISFTTNAGQANYAAGCTFKDAFAHYIGQQGSFPVKIVNWGFWGSVGIVASEQYQKKFTAGGVQSIEPAEGMEAIRRIVGNPVTQVMAAKADQQIWEKLGFELQHQVEFCPERIPSLIDAVLKDIENPDEQDDTTEDNEYLNLFRQGLDALEEVGRYSLLRAFRQMGVFHKAGEKYDRNALREQIKIIPAYYRLFDAILDILQTPGAEFLHAAENVIITTEKVAQKQVQDDLDNLEMKQQELIEKFPVIAAYAKLQWQCTSAYPEVLTGLESHHQVMFPGGRLDLVEDIYKGNKVVDFYNRLVARLVKAYLGQRLKDISPADLPIRVLEVGAGTGGTSAFILEAINEFGQNIKYFYTDLSVKFIHHGNREFGGRYPFIQCSVLDIEKDPAAQGFTPGSMDLVLGTNVFHATKRIANSLQQAKGLLKTNGLLILNEITQIQNSATLIFGLTDGWWLFEDEENRIKGSPLLDQAKWQLLLKTGGYRNIRTLAFPGIPREHSKQEVIIAESNGEWLCRKKETWVKPAAQTGHIVPATTGTTIPASMPQPVREQSIDVKSFIREKILGVIAGSLGLNPSDIDCEKEFSHYGVDSIIAVELVDKINKIFAIVLKTITIFDYSTVKSLADFIYKTHGEKIAGAQQKPSLPFLQVSTPAFTPAFTPVTPVMPVTSDPPVHQAAPGVENIDVKNYIREKILEVIAGSLGLNPGDLDCEKEFSHYGVDSIIAVELVDKINKIFSVVLKTITIFDYSTVKSLANFISEKYGDQIAGSLIKTPQFPSVSPAVPVIPVAPVAPVQIFPYRDQVEETVLMPGETKVPAIILTRPINIPDLQLSYVQPREPREHEVQILVKAFSLNFGDLLCVKGLYPLMPEYPFTPGSEVAGIVIKKGRDVTQFKEGDAVIGLPGLGMGGHSAIVNADERLVVKKPDTITFEEACAFPTVFITMYIVFEKIMPEPGEKILIQTAAGGTGLIAVQLARLHNLEIFATAGSQKKIAYLEAMGAHHTINYRKEDFARRIMEQTGNSGVDIVINTLAGDAIQKGIDILAPGGRYMEIAMTGLKSSDRLNLSNMTDNQIFYTLDIKKMIIKHPERAGKYLNIMARYLQEGKVKPTVGKVFSFTQIQDAYRCLEDRENIGKVIVTPGLSAGPGVAGVAGVAGINAEAPVPVRQVQQVHQARPVTGDIAVIGMAGQFPGAKNVAEYWRNLAEGKNCIIEPPPERWDADKYYDPDLQNKNATNCKWAGFLQDIDRFDALFFNMSGKEAELCDPQHRLFLEECWKALEDAGYADETISNKKCGVFVGTSTGDYIYKLKKANLMPQEPYTFTGNASAVAGARISYFLNLKGPSLSIDTACSSSLVAIHLAYRSIMDGDCEMALTGGVCMYTSPEFHILTSNTGMLSPDGKCKTFDDDADGFVPGEGVGVVVLKPLAAALRDRDQIYGVIKGSGINQDGKTNGITAPNSLSQTELELAVYRENGLNPEDITFIEAHGTGTKLGDPIEIEALTNAFRQYTAKKQYCAVGSVKTNIGHASSASGVAGLIKILLAFQHHQIPPSLNYKKPNRHIDFQNSPFYVVTQLTPWETGGKPKMAAVSSFGFSGTNAHVVLAEPPAPPAPPASPAAAKDGSHPFYFIPFAAKTPEALAQKHADLIQWLQENPGVSIGNVAYTLLKGRSRFPVRSALVVKDTADFVDKLQKICRAGNTQANTPPHFFSFNLKENPGELNNRFIQKAEQIIRELPSLISNPGAYLDRCSTLADLYTRGYEPDWRELYRDSRYTFISLPAYPFSRDKYWIDEPGEPGDDHRVSRGSVNRLHPLIDSNTSTLKELRFTTRSLNNPWTPWMFLEMARAAGDIAADGEERVRIIKNVAWARPPLLEELLRGVHASLFPGRDSVEYEVFSGNGQGGPVTPVTVHSQGKLIYKWTSTLQEHPIPEPAFETIKAQCAAPGRIWLKNDGEAWGRIDTPVSSTPWENSTGDWVLHPGLLEGVGDIIAAVLAPDQPVNGVDWAPVKLAELQILAPLTGSCYVQVRGTGQSNENNENHTFTLRFVDPQGKILINMKELSLIKLKKQQTLACCR